MITLSFPSFGVRIFFLQICDEQNRNESVSWLSRWRHYVCASEFCGRWPRVCPLTSTGPLFCPLNHRLMTTFCCTCEYTKVKPTYTHILRFWGGWLCFLNFHNKVHEGHMITAGIKIWEQIVYKASQQLIDIHLIWASELNKRLNKQDEAHPAPVWNPVCHR